MMFADRAAAGRALAGRLAAAGPGAGGSEAPIGASDLVRALPAAFRSL
jgi:hypothetical protein